jgi:hypothetical protein
VDSRSARNVFTAPSGDLVASNPGNTLQVAPFVAHWLVVELRSRVNPPVLAADDPNQALVGQYYRKEPRSKNVIKVFDYLNRLPIKPVAMVIAGIAANIEEPLTTDPCCGDSENIASYLGNGYSASRVFLHFSGLVCLKMFSRR